MSTQHALQATHVVHPVGTERGEAGAAGAKHVSSQWLQDSIKLKKVQDERLYRVKLVKN